MSITYKTLFVRDAEGLSWFDYRREVMISNSSKVNKQTQCMFPRAMQQAGGKDEARPLPPALLRFG
jgi:hypothetical protein